MARYTHRLRRLLPPSLPLLRNSRTNTLSNIHFPRLRRPLLQTLPNFLLTFSLHKPRRGSKIIFTLTSQQLQHLLDIRPRLRQPVLQRRYTLRILQIKRRHLHVPRSLTRTTGEMVGVELEVAAFERHEGDEGCGFARRGDAVGFE